MYERSGPDPAERLRSLVAAASSLTLYTPGFRANLAGRHSVDDDGRLLLELPGDSCFAGQLRKDGDVAAAVELTDLAPTAVRNRVRSRATLSGWLTPVEDTPATGTPSGRDWLAALDLVAAELIEPYGVTDVDPAEFSTARPDPLAEAEGELLCHLVDGHPQVLDALARLVPASHLYGVRRVTPLRLDRYGIVLRLEFAGRDADVRLPFHEPLTHPEQAASRMLELLARASRCHR